MSPEREGDLIRRLSEPEADEPPAGLLDRLKADIPAELGTHPGLARPGAAAPAPSARRLWLAAATVAATLAAGWLAVERWRPSPELAAPEPAPPTASRDAAGRAAAAAPAAPAAPETEERKLEAQLQQDSPRRQGNASQPPAPRPAVPPPAPPAVPAPRSEAYFEKDERRPVAAISGGVAGGAVGGVAGGSEDRAAPAAPPAAKRMEPAPQAAAAAPMARERKAAEETRQNATPAAPPAAADEGVFDRIEVSPSAESPADKEKAGAGGKPQPLPEKKPAGRSALAAEVGSDAWMARFDRPAAPLEREGLRATLVPGLASGTVWLRVEARAGGAGTLTVEPVAGQVEGLRPLAGGARAPVVAGEAARIFWYQLRLTARPAAARPLVRLALRLRERTLTTRAEGRAGERFDAAPAAVRLAALAAELAQALSHGERGRLAEIARRGAALASELAGRPLGPAAAELAETARQAAE